MIKKLWLAIAVMLPLLCFSACSDDKDEDLDKALIVGTWQSEKMQIETNRFSYFEAIIRQDNTCEVSTVIEHDDSLNHGVSKSTDKGTYSINGKRIILSSEEHREIAYFDVVSIDGESCTAKIKYLDGSKTLDLKLKKIVK